MKRARYDFVAAQGTSASLTTRIEAALFTMD